MDRYYETARFWAGGLGNVFALSLTELQQALVQAQRIAALESRGR